MGGDVEHVGAVSPFHLTQQVLHAHGLQNPVGRSLQVVQKHIAHNVLPVQQGPLDGDIQAQPLSQAGLEKQQRRASPGNPLPPRRQ